MNTVYYFGAGASTPFLPMALKLSEDIKNTIKLMQEAINSQNRTPGMPFPKELRASPEGPIGENLITSMNWLADASSKHFSVDTLAKKLWIRNDHRALELLYKLKCILTCYFLFKQMSNFTDKRYDSFFSRILDRKEPGRPSFPKNIGILSWNYDGLLEKSYSDFCIKNTCYIEDILLNHNISKLNGSILEIQNQDGTKALNLINISETSSSNCINTIMNIYDNMTSNPPSITPGIKFAWEDIDISNAKNIISDCNNLIIIGYSFPYFNRDIDKSILNEGQKIEKIFLQCNGDKGSKERLNQLLFEIRHPIRKSNSIIEIQDTEYFYIP